MTGDWPEREVRTEKHLQECLSEMIRALRAVEAGEHTRRIELNLSETDPIGALAFGVNAVIRRLASSREETLLYQQEIEARCATIDQQQVAIRDLSTPMIEVLAGVMCVPIVGIIDSARAADMTSALLTAVVEQKVVYSIIDITGIEVMDTKTIDHFLRMARSVRLLGAECVLSGIHPNIAQSIVHMGLDVGGLQSFRSLRAALQHYLRLRDKGRSTKKDARARAKEVPVDARHENAHGSRGK